MGTRPIIYKYPLDLTGRNPNNLVLAEPHTLAPGVNRAFVPNYGAFYSESLVVRDLGTGLPLIPHEQYVAVQLYEEATQLTGLEVCTVIVVTDSNVSDLVDIDYQAIGGEFSYSVSALREMIDGLDLDERPVIWGSILGTPNAFPPAPHLHDAGDLYGFEYLVEALDGISFAILTGNEVRFEELRQFVIAGLEHGGLEKSSSQDAIDGERDDVYLTPLKMRQAFDVWVEGLTTTDPEELFNQHMEQTNPHGTNATHLGLGSVDDIDPVLVYHGEMVAINAFFEYV